MSVPKEDLYRLVEAMPETKVPRAKRALEEILNEDNEEFLTEDEKVAAEKGWQEYIEGKARPWAEIREELARES